MDIPAAKPRKSGRRTNVSREEWRTPGEKNNFWRAHRCLLEYGLNPGNTSTRISSIEAILSSDVNVQTRLQNEIILAEILLRSDRLAEASVMTKDIERDAVARPLISICALDISRCASRSPKSSQKTWLLTGYAPNCSMQHRKEGENEQALREFAL
jgi:hypothetical protein